MAAVVWQLSEALPKGWEGLTGCSQPQQWQCPQGEWQASERGRAGS